MNIGVLGGGIAGLSTAIALNLQGFDVSVYERNNKPSKIGAGIVCWPNASFVLDQLGILDEVAKISGSIHSMNRYSSDGRPIGTLNINELNRLMTFPSYSIIRKDLMAILAQRAAELNIKIHYNFEVTEISTTNSRATVTFSNGNKVQPDVTVGADGRMKSLARKYICGHNAPIYQGFINWIGVIEDSSVNFSELAVSDYWGVGERFGIVPVSKNKAYWAGGAVSKTIDQIVPSKYKTELHSIFAGWPSIITEIIKGTPQSRINKIYVHDHDPINLWHKNNLVLLGDAAHAPLPTSGQGACQALEDAWQLTRCLTKNSNNITNAFKEFTELRKAKTSGITIGGRHLASSIFNQDEKLCKQRDIASKQTNYQNAVIGMAKAWSHRLPIEV